MKFVFLGLSITSSWGNGHATTYRALLAQLRARGHEILFLERDAEWYANNRDLPAPAFCRVALYRSREELESTFADEVRRADVVVMGSFVPEGVAVGDWVQRTSRGLTAFYDIDTPITLAKLRARDELYLSARQIPRYSLYLSFTGGPTLELLERTFGSPAARALYCSVDPSVHHPLDRETRWDLGYLGTYSADRQPTVQRLLLDAAKALPARRFACFGPQYPESIAWPRNVEREVHLEPKLHVDFYNAQRFTLNVTRAEMVRAGWSPSVRLFEAAACAVPVISDEWPGLAGLFRANDEILIARSTDDVIRFLKETSPAEARKIGERARRRALAEHTAEVRAEQLERMVIERRDALARAGLAHPLYPTNAAFAEEV